MRSELREAIALLRNGNEKSTERAFQLLRKTVLSFGMKVCGHREDAEDTAQEVLVRSLPHLATLEDPRAMSAWLYTAAKNRCWDNRRKLSFRKSVALEDLIPGDAELNALLLADKAASPEDNVLGEQNRQSLHRAVLHLPPQYRIVLVLHDMEELDTELVAKVLSLQPGTVRVRLHRARLLLRKEMAHVLRKIPERAAPAHSARRPSECREIFANLSDYLDGEMPAESCQRMRRHIEACPACVAFIHDLKRAIDRCRSLGVCPDPGTAPALRRLLTEEYLRLKNSRASL